MEEELLEEVARAIARVRFGRNWSWSDLPAERREEFFAQAAAALQVLEPVAVSEVAIQAVEICRDLAATPPPLNLGLSIAMCALCGGGVPESGPAYGEVSWHRMDCPYRRAWTLLEGR
jgi:hypothetical protein